MQPGAADDTRGQRAAAFIARGAHALPGLAQADAPTQEQLRTNRLGLLNSAWLTFVLLVLPLAIATPVVFLREADPRVCDLLRVWTVASVLRLAIVAALSLAAYRAWVLDANGVPADPRPPGAQRLQVLRDVAVWAGVLLFVVGNVLLEGADAACRPTEVYSLALWIVVLQYVMILGPLVLLCAGCVLMLACLPCLETLAMQAHLREAEARAAELRGRAAATAAQIRALPEARFVPTLLPPGTDPTCAICLSPLGGGERVRKLPCAAAHVFHRDCIDEWLRINSTCPVDRHQLFALAGGSGNATAAGGGRGAGGSGGGGGAVSAASAPRVAPLGAAGDAEANAPSGAAVLPPAPSGSTQSASPAAPPAGGPFSLLSLTLHRVRGPAVGSAPAASAAGDGAHLLSAPVSPIGRTPVPPPPPPPGGRPPLLGTAAIGAPAGAARARRSSGGDGPPRAPPLSGGGGGAALGAFASVVPRSLSDSTPPGSVGAMAAAAAGARLHHVSPASAGAGGGGGPHAPEGADADFVWTTAGVGARGASFRGGRAAVPSWTPSGAPARGDVPGGLATGGDAAAPGAGGAALSGRRAAE